MTTFLSLVGVAVLMAAFLATFRHRKPETPAPEPSTDYVSPINGDSRLPQGALFLPDYNA